MQWLAAETTDTQAFSSTFGSRDIIYTDVACARFILVVDVNAAALGAVSSCNPGRGFLRIHPDVGALAWQRDTRLGELAFVAVMITIARVTHA